MKSSWTKHLKDPDDKKALELAVRNSSVALERLTDIIKEKHRKKFITDYACPSWAYLRADKDGYDRALNEIIELLNLDQKGK